MQSTKRYGVFGAGMGYLVATTGWGLEAGYCRIALPTTADIAGGGGGKAGGKK
jgi:hypothetical protein